VKARETIEAAIAVAPESEQAGLRARLIELGGSPREETPEAAPETGGGG